ncbi:MAG: RnfABCDGE type electron transport complex subunit D [Planctomycetota bacterium]|nr:MAG: RnfABCDGE type electron transport complex subunit D [Planctomycetota bacterium]
MALDKLVVGHSPHIKSDESIRRIMWTVVLALTPAGVFGIIIFGWYALVMMLGSMAVCIATEWIILKLTGRDAGQAFDGSAAITGMLFAMVCGPLVHWYVWVVGSIVAIAVFKHAFGGLGCNIWNPALMARAFTLAAWGKDLTQGFVYPDGTAGATPLGVVKLAKEGVPIDTEYLGLNELFWGKTAGCIGETSAALLLLGGIFLIVLKYVDWRMPLSFILTCVVLVWILPYKNKAAQDIASGWVWWKEPLFAAFSGGLFLGAFFMATDMVTTPVTKTGQVIFGVGCGILTAIIRLYGGYPEGVCYSIIIMNTATPLIDRFTRPRKFGAKEYARTTS